MLPVFYINLTTRPDRRAYMERQFEQLGITAERFEAITPANPDPHWLALSQLPRNRGKLSPSELGCTLSHRGIWQLVQERGLDAALVLEDDMELSPALPIFLGAPLPGGVDIVRIETRFRSMTLGREVLFSGGRIRGRQMLSHDVGAGGYVISREAARRWANDERLAGQAVDKFLFGRDGPCLRRDNIIQLIPALTAPRFLVETDEKDGVVQSDINPERMARRKKRPAKRSLAVRLRRPADNLRHIALELVHVVRKSAIGHISRQSIAFDRGGTK